MIGLRDVPTADGEAARVAAFDFDPRSGYSDQHALRDVFRMCGSVPRCIDAKHHQSERDGDRTEVRRADRSHHESHEPNERATPRGLLRPVSSILDLVTDDDVERTLKLLPA